MRKISIALMAVVVASTLGSPTANADRRFFFHSRPFFHARPFFRNSFVHRPFFFRRPFFVNRSFVSFGFFGFPFYYPPYAYWPDYYAPSAPAADQVGPGPAPAQYWYYCDNPAGYYPYVQSCSTSWRPVPVVPPTAPGAPAAQGDREVTALNLLAAKGYRDFKTIRRSGENFIIDTVHGGKNVTVTINPDTGQISEGI
jgi:hypothetical protein